jgi:hypothetical protein
LHLQWLRSFSTEVHLYRPPVTNIMAGRPGNRRTRKLEYLAGRRVSNVSHDRSTKVGIRVSIGQYNEILHLQWLRSFSTEVHLYRPPVTNIMADNHLRSALIAGMETSH